MLAAPSASPHRRKWPRAGAGRRKPNSAQGRRDAAIAPSATAAISPWVTACLAHGWRVVTGSGRTLAARNAAA